MLPELPAVGRCLCCSLHSSTSIALVPARSGSKHTGPGGANYKCGLSVLHKDNEFGDLGALGLSDGQLDLDGMVLEMFTGALIPALLIHCPFSAGCLWKGHLAHLLSGTASVSPQKSLL